MTIHEPMSEEAIRDEQSHYLVFGDLHGRILPAFRLAQAWSRENDIRLDGLLQVGDLGYFPDPGRLDKATRRHAERDPLELGAQWVAEPSSEADAILQSEDSPPPLWFIAGNHEDFSSLQELMNDSGAHSRDFAVDAYQRVWCIRDGGIATLPGGLKVGGLWGIDDKSPRARRGVPPRGYIRRRSAMELSAGQFDVLLTHDSPRDAVFDGAGSELISDIIEMARPHFAFFGHYHCDGWVSDFRDTEVFHMAGFEMRGYEGGAEHRSVGFLSWFKNKAEFTYLDEAWLRRFTRHNWRYR